jgi:YD repeat-containing protein
VTLATSVELDDLDRPVLTTYPDGATARSEFAIEAPPGGVLLFRTRSIDENGHARESFADLLGRTRVFTEHPTPGASPTTTYEYLATGELSRITDAEGNVTTLGYDLRATGRSR